MSTDRFISGVQLPNVDQAVTVRASDSSDYRRTYYKSGDLYQTDEAGTESKLTGRIATTTTLGEVIVDGTTITVDAAGIISSVGGGGGIDNIVEDTTPQLGGNLDLNSFDIDGTGNISITGNASIVGNINVTSTINMISPDTNHNISIEMLDTDTVSFSGDSGELFSVTDSMTGTIYSVNDISGVPSIEVDDDGTIRFAEITGNVLIGTNVDDGIHKLQISGDVSANAIQLTGGAGSDGTVSWNTDESTLDLIEGNTTLQIGQEVLYNVKNQTGSTISDGTPVMAAGTLGNSGRILIAPMDATNPANAKFYIGVTTETIADGADGKVTHFGKVRGIDLSAYQEGDVLWLSTDTVGAFTTTEPTIGIKVPTAFVISNSSNGTMMVRATKSMGLVDLDDVFKETLDANNDGQVLTWNNTNSRFEVSAITESQISDLQSYLTSVTFSDIDANSVLVNADTYDDQDDQLMSALAINSLITSKGYLSSITQADVTQYEVALTITESQISDLQNYLTTVPAEYLTQTEGDARYLQSYTETDPVFSVSVAFNISSTDVSNWNTAYGWGDHSVQGYLTSETDTLDDVTGRGNTTTNNITAANLTATNKVSTDLLEFATDVTSPIHQEGCVFYDNVAKALAVYNDESDVTLQVGQEHWVRVYNNTGATITNGTPIYLSGEINGIPTAALSSALTETAAEAVGLATHDIEDATFGYVTTQGIVFDVDTSGLTQGAKVHVSETPGVLQTSAPTYPFYTTDIGICLISGVTNGCIYVNPVSHHSETFRTSSDASFDGNVRIGGNLTLLGSQSTVSVSNIRVDDNIIYLNGGDAIKSEDTTFTGTGLNDATFKGYYEGNDAGTTYYVRIDGAGTGTGGVDTFEWSTDNFATTEATGVDITGEEQNLSNNIAILFNATTGHTSGDTWSGTAQPSNVDIGFMGNRNTGASGGEYSHVGFFFDTADGRFKTFSEYALDPIGGNINASDASFVSGDLQVKDLYATNITGISFTGNAATASALQSSRNFSITGAVTAPNESFNGTGNVTLTATLNSDLSDLNDVSATTPTDGQVLTWNNSTSVWEPADSAGGGGAFQPIKLDSISTVNGQASYTMQLSSSNYTPSSDFALIVSLNGIIQEPGTAFSTSGSTITFVPALSTGDVIDFIVDFGNAVDIGTITETDTLASVTARGNTTTEIITVGGIDINGEVVELTRNATLSGTQALNPALGTIQRIVMNGNITFTDTLANGEAITLMIDDGAGNTITWPTIAWIGGSAPTLDITNLTTIQVWKINGNLYGASVGVSS